MPPRILIIGIGSPVGDDRVGLVAAERLRADARLAARVVVQNAERAGLRLIELWAPTDCVILLDAVVTGARPGTVLRIPAEHIESTRSPWSSHGIGPAEAIALARVLDRLPARLVLFGVEIAAPPKERDLSAEIVEALPRLTRQVVDEIEVLCHASAPAN